MAKFYELFAGVGLVRDALEPLGWECVYANDFDASKQAIYGARFPVHEHFDGRDLWIVDAAELPRPVDLIAASFPCIDLSLAGNRRGLAGDHSGAFWAFTSVLEGLATDDALPKALMIENVTGFLSSNEGEDFRVAVRALNSLGYRADAVQVTAEHFTPQSRPRLFLLGVREDLARLTMALPEQMGEDEWIDAVEAASHVRPRRVRELMTGGALGGQTPLFDGGQDEALRWGATSFPELPQRTQDFSDVVEWTGDSWWTPERTARALDEMNPLHQAKVERMVAASAEGRGPQAATAYRRRRNGRSVYEVRSDGVAGCLRTARGGSSTQIVVVASDGEARMRWMSPREYARLQGCEYQEALDAFGDAALKTAFGDAVCVPAVRWIAEHAFGPLKDLADAPEPVAQGAEAPA